MWSPRRILIATFCALGVAGLAALFLWPGDGREVERLLQDAVEAMRPFPRRIDDATELVEARAEGRRMTYVYRLLQEVPVEVEQQRRNLERVVCSAEPMRNALREGVVFVYEYRAKDEPGRTLARIEISRCP